VEQKCTWRDPSGHGKERDSERGSQLERGGRGKGELRIPLRCRNKEKGGKYKKSITLHKRKKRKASRKRRKRKTRGKGTVCRGEGVLPLFFWGLPGGRFKRGVKIMNKSSYYSGERGRDCSVEKKRMEEGSASIFLGGKGTSQENIFGRKGVIGRKKDG